MSSSQSNNPSKFIPILTEIIDEPDQSRLDFDVEVGAQGAIREKGRVSVNIFGGAIPVNYVVPPKEPPADEQEAALYGPVERVELVEPVREQPVEPQIQPQPMAEIKAEQVSRIKPNIMDWQDRPSMPVSRTEKKQNERSDDQAKDMGGATCSSAENEIKEEEFSPISHNPLAKEDQLRPSDLMLVALTERIASKVRMRVSKDLDLHIQDKIFPLLDSFADQLVKHLEIDLLKIIREGIAEATREELERLSQRGKK